MKLGGKPIYFQSGFTPWWITGRSIVLWYICQLQLG